jgi:4-diphosphocytidyl-2-C-methyl-D-erythritol kinase
MAAAEHRMHPVQGLLTTRAPAKVNLTLRVLGRRDDGYHELDSLVAFAGIGDALSLDPAAAEGLSIIGPFASGLSGGPDNLVLRALSILREALPQLRAGHIQLTKRLPVASGIGGGSADAAAALRLLARLNGLPTAHPALRAAAARIGADVAVCLEPRARIMRGIGEQLGPPLVLPPLFAVLVNPGLPVETASVFRRLGLAAGETHRGGAEPLRLPSQEPLIAALAACGNDLEGPARQLAPQIAETLEALAAQPGCRLARMSGSGATCFALFDDREASTAAARRLARPDWWVKPTVLR